MSTPATPSSPILPGSTLGVLGGGQLGQMFVHAAQAMGYKTAVLDPDPHGPASQVSQLQTSAAYDDAQALEWLAAQSAAVTTEFENVPAASLSTLAHRVRVAPPAAAVAIAQERHAEKQHFTQAGVPCAPFAIIDSAAAAASADPALFPAILKTSRMGYDGKGQLTVQHAADLPAAWAQLGSVHCVLEKRLALDFECSVLVARAATGEMVNLPVQRNLHHRGILAVTEVYAGNVPEAAAAHAVAAARAIAQSMDYVGVLCVEFFVLKDGSVIANEMAPRPHNSGHYSQDACDVCQFELQVRTLTGLPLVQPVQHSSAVMLNLLGDLWFAPEDTQGQNPITPNWPAALALPGVHLHLYGKTQARHGRKMGHINITAATPEAALQTAREVARILKLGVDF